MNILIIDTVEFDLNGITSVILNYENHIDKTDICMDYVLTGMPFSDLKSQLEKNGAKVFVIKRNKTPLSYMWNLFKVIRQGKYEIVHIHGNSATMTIELLAAWLAGVPVRIVHSHNTSCTHPTIHKLLLPLFRRLYTHGFACGKEAGEWLFGERDFKIIRNGIDLERFSFSDSVRKEYRQKLNIVDQITIGHVGNFVAQKNHMFLLSAFAEVLKVNQKYKLILIGTGPLENEVQQEIHRLHLDGRVEFLGKSFEVDKYLQAIDIFVLPSLYEGLPVSLIEAQATGLPCIVSDRVSRQVSLIDLVEFLDIESPMAWGERIIEVQPFEHDRSKNIQKYHEQIRRSGYDINYNARGLKALYMELVK